MKSSELIALDPTWLSEIDHLLECKVCQSTFDYVYGELSLEEIRKNIPQILEMFEYI